MKWAQVQYTYITQRRKDTIAKYLLSCKKAPISIGEQQNLCPYKECSLKQLSVLSVINAGSPDRQAELLQIFVKIQFYLASITLWKIYNNFLNWWTLKRKNLNFQYRNFNDTFCKISLFHDVVHELWTMLLLRRTGPWS